MPRIAKPPDAELPRLRRELSAYLDRVGSNPNSFAKLHGVSQSTVQRFLAGRTKNITASMRPLLIYAGIHTEDCMVGPHSPPDIMGHERIKQALAKVWDGDEASASMLAKFIEAVGPLLIKQRQDSR